MSRWPLGILGNKVDFKLGNFFLNVILLFFLRADLKAMAFEQIQCFEQMAFEQLNTYSLYRYPG